MRYIISSQSAASNKLYFHKLEGVFGSEWKWKSEAQIFNSKETALCVVQELKKRHNNLHRYEIEEIEEVPKKG